MGVADGAFIRSHEEYLGGVAMPVAVAVVSWRDDTKFAQHTMMIYIASRTVNEPDEDTQPICDAWDSAAADANIACSKK